MPVDTQLVAYFDSQPSITDDPSANPPSLIEGPMPELPDNCVAVTHYGSEQGEEYVMGASLSEPGYEIENVQVMVRHTAKATAQSKAQAYHSLLDNLGPTTLSGVLFSHVDSDGVPYCLGQDANERWRYVANYRVRKARG